MTKFTTKNVDETAYRLSTSENRACLLEAIEELEAGSEQVRVPSMPSITGP